MRDKITENHIQPESKEHDDRTDYDGEPHLVNLSLLNTLFPYIELQTGLNTTSLLSHGYNIDPESIIDRFKIGNSHQEERLEGLTQIGGGWVNRILTLVDQIENLNNDRILK